MLHTVTVNPALDLSYRVPAVKLDDTVRASAVLRAAGGKGINVSRVAARLGHPTVAMGFVGGRAGDELEELLSDEGIRTWLTRCACTTRTNVIVQDDAGRQIRVSSPGGTVTPAEVAALHASVFNLRAPDFLVLGGNLLPGMPEDFYSRLMQRANAEGVKVAVDADGEVLRAAVAAGAYLIKPNQYELSRLVGKDVHTLDEVVDAAYRTVEAGVGAVLASLGAKGAVLVTGSAAWRATPPEVAVDSAVGAGDSALAGALLARAEGAGWAEALRLAVACGTATAKTPGTELCYPETIRALLPEVRVEPLEVLR